MYVISGENAADLDSIIQCRSIY